MSRFFTEAPGSYLNLVDSAILEPVNAMTVFAWVYSVSPGANDGNIFSHRPGFGAGYTFGVACGAGGHLRWLRGGKIATDSTIFPLCNEWAFLAAATSTGNVRFSILQAGTWQHENVAMGNDYFLGVTTDWVATSFGGGGSEIHGKIQHLGVYIGDTLSDADLATIAFGSMGSITPQPDLWMPICGQVDPEPDLSGNGLDGTVVGSAPCADEPPGLEECPACPGAARHLPFLHVGR